MIKKIFKKILWVVVVFVAIDVAAVIALPHLVPMEKLSQLLQSQVKEATGRDLTFKGADIMLWPHIGVELKDVTFSNAVWAQDKEMITLGKADVALAIAPLFDHHVVIQKFVLNEPVIRLEVSEDGRANWDLSGAPVAEGAAKDGQKAASGGAPGFDLSFGHLEITKGKLVFNDRQKKTVTTLDDVNVKATLPDMKSALQLDGSLVYKGQKLDVTLGLDKPMDIMNGKTSPGQFSVKSGDFAASADGTLATQGTLLKGTLKLNVSSLPGMMAWVQGAKPEKLPFEKVSFESEARLSKSDIILKDAILKLDDLQAKGDINATFGGKPDIFARLSVGKLNLDRFTNGADAVKGASADAVKGASDDAAKDAPSSGWDTTPIDFSALRALNADMRLDTQGFSLKGADVGPSTLTVTIQDGTMHFKSSEATLFGGKFSSDLTVKAAATPTMTFNFTTAGVEAKPVLTTFAHFKKLSGTASAHVTLSGAGNTQKAIIGSLDGKGDVTFKNGALEGIDLVKIARLVQARSTDVSAGDGKTEFVELGGTFTITNGIMVNNDMQMKGPLLTATGKGQVDLPRKYIQYRTTPMLMTSAAADSKSIAIPVDIKGPFSDIKVVPDFLSVAQSIAQDPSAVKATAKNVKENIKSIRQDIKKNPGAAIQNLLNGGIGGLLNGAPQQQAAPSPAPSPATPPATSPAAPAPQEAAPQAAPQAEPAPTTVAPAPAEQPAPAAPASP